MDSLISKIIPTYNRAHIIGDTLQPLLSQTFTNRECIIVDDHKPKGTNSCRNFGFEKSNGNYVQWFDSDDLYYPFALEENLHCIKNGFDVTVSQLDIIDFNTSDKIRKNRIYSANLIEDYLTGNVAFYISGPFWNRKFLERQDELFDESISNLDDWDFNLRMLYQNPKINFLEKPLAAYRIHSESLTFEINKLNYKEITSEIFAREKHLKILRSLHKENYKTLNFYIEKRLKSFFIVSMEFKDKNRFRYLKMLIKKQVELNNFFGVMKSVSAFSVYYMFGKGYYLLKKI